MKTSPCDKKMANFLCNLSPREDTKKGLSPAFAGLVFISAILFCDPCHSFTTEASYYTYASCIREGTSGIMANGEKLNDEALICASWDYRFGTRLLVTNKRNGRSVVVCVTDRGPAKRLYKNGRKIDLSKKAMQVLGGIKKGIITVDVQPLP